MKKLLTSVGVASLTSLALMIGVADARTVKPVLHGQNWVAVTGKPLAATAGAKIFIAGGNALGIEPAELDALRPAKEGSPNQPHKPVSD